MNEKHTAVAADQSSIHDVTTKGDVAIGHSPEMAAFLASSPEERAAVEKKLIRKVDMRLIPWMT